MVHLIRQEMWATLPAIDQFGDGVVNSWENIHSMITYYGGKKDGGITINKTLRLCINHIILNPDDAEGFFISYNHNSPLVDISYQNPQLVMELYFYSPSCPDQRILWNFANFVTPYVMCLEIPSLSVAMQAFLRYMSTDASLVSCALEKLVYPNPFISNWRMIRDFIRTHLDLLPLVNASRVFECAASSPPSEYAAEMTLFYTSFVLPTPSQDLYALESNVYYLAENGCHDDFLRMNVLLAAICDRAIAALPEVDVATRKVEKIGLRCLSATCRLTVISVKLMDSLSILLTAHPINMTLARYVDMRAAECFLAMCTVKRVRKSAAMIYFSLCTTVSTLIQLSVKVGLYDVVSNAYALSGKAMPILPMAGLAMRDNRLGLSYASTVRVCTDLVCEEVLAKYCMRMRCPCSLVAQNPLGNMDYLSNLEKGAGRIPTEVSDFLRSCRLFITLGARREDYVHLIPTKKMFSIKYERDSNVEDNLDPYNARVADGISQIRVSYENTSESLHEIVIRTRPIPKAILWLPEVKRAPEGKEGDAIDELPLKVLILPFTSQILSFHGSPHFSESRIPIIYEFINSIIITALDTSLPMLHYVLDYVFPSRVYAPPPEISLRKAKGGDVPLFMSITRGVLPLLSMCGGFSAGTTREIVDREFMFLLKTCWKSTKGGWWPIRTLSTHESYMLGVLIAYSLALMTPPPFPLGKAVYHVVCGVDMEKNNPADFVGLDACRHNYEELRGALGGRSCEVFGRFFSRKRMSRNMEMRSILGEFAKPVTTPYSAEWLRWFTYAGRDKYPVECLVESINGDLAAHPGLIQRYAGGSRGLFSRVGLIFPRTRVIVSAVKEIRVHRGTLILPMSLCTSKLITDAMIREG
jgi:hypothetical protein